MASPILVYVHDDLDGWASAGVVFRYLGYDSRSAGRERVAVVYHDYSGPLAVLPERGQEVYALDLALTARDLNRLAETGARVTWIDHHASSIRLRPNMSLPADWRIVLSTESCAAVLTWKTLMGSATVPEVLRLVDHHDRWTFSDAERPLILALDHRVRAEGGKAFWCWDYCMGTNIPVDIREDLERDGAVLAESADARVEALAKDARLAVIDGYDALIVNSAWDRNELANQLLQREFPDRIAWVWSVAQKDGRSIVRNSLRSLPGGPDVSRIAERRGGGGHAQAAGWTGTVLELLGVIG